MALGGCGIRQVGPGTSQKMSRPDVCSAQVVCRDSEQVLLCQALWVPWSHGLGAPLGAAPQGSTPAHAAPQHRQLVTSHM